MKAAKATHPDPAESVKSFVAPVRYVGSGPAVYTTSTALMFRSDWLASASAAFTAPSELSGELPTTSMIFVTANAGLHSFPVVRSLSR